MSNEDDFYVEDELLDKVLAAFESGEKGLTMEPTTGPPKGWRCPHLTVHSTPAGISRPTTPCGCVMEPWEPVPADERTP